MGKIVEPGYIEISANSDVRYFLLNANGYGTLIARKEQRFHFVVSF